MHSSWYRSRKYIIGLDLEKISGAGFTGLSTKAGYLLTLSFKDCDADGAADSVPTRVFCALSYDCSKYFRWRGDPFFPTNVKHKSHPKLNKTKKYIFV